MSGGGSCLEHYRQQAELAAAELADVDACRRLWRAVIEKAAMDLIYLAGLEGKNGLTDHERSKLAKILEFPPAEFIAGGWFDELCAYMGERPAEVRDWIGDLVS